MAEDPKEPGSRDERVSGATSSRRPSSSPWPSARPSSSQRAATSPPAPPDATPGAPWAAPLDRLDKAWTRLDARLCAIVLMADILTLVGWISLKALSNSGQGGPGLVFRVMATALVFGGVTHLSTRNHPKRQLVTTVATLVGAVLGALWGDAGSAYFANILAWLQNASILVFFGGASDIAKRLTLWLALLGASVATGQGKHINVDVVMRFLSPRARVPVAVLGWVAAAVVCMAGVWGFFDHVAVEDFRVATSMPCPGDASKQCPTPPGVKVDKVLHETSRDLFLAGRQLSLDLRTLPKVLGGTPYSKSLMPREWNEWLRGGGWESHFAKDDVKALELPDDSTDFRTPAVTAVPGGSERVHMLLVREFNFVFAFGLLVISLRFLLRSILAFAGWVKVDPNAAHGDDELVHAHEGAAEELAAAQGSASGGGAR